MGCASVSSVSPPPVAGSSTPHCPYVLSLIQRSVLGHELSCVFVTSTTIVSKSEGIKIVYAGCAFARSRKITHRCHSSQSDHSHNPSAFRTPSAPHVSIVVPGSIRVHHSHVPFDFHGLWISALTIQALCHSVDLGPSMGSGVFALGHRSSHP